VATAAVTANDANASALYGAINWHPDNIEHHDKLHISYAEVCARLVWKCKNWLKAPTLDLVKDISALAK
jgi:hypothetical protein